MPKFSFTIYLHFTVLFFFRNDPKIHFAYIINTDTDQMKLLVKSIFSLHITKTICYYIMNFPFAYIKLLVISGLV